MICILKRHWTGHFCRITQNNTNVNTVLSCFYFQKHKISFTLKFVKRFNLLRSDGWHTIRPVPMWMVTPLPLRCAIGGRLANASTDKITHLSARYGVPGLSSLFWGELVAPFNGRLPYPRVTANVAR